MIIVACISEWYSPPWTVLRKHHLTSFIVEFQQHPLASHFCSVIPSKPQLTRLFGSIALHVPGCAQKPHTTISKEMHSAHIKRLMYHKSQSSDKVAQSVECRLLMWKVRTLNPGRIQLMTFKFDVCHYLLSF